MNDDVPDEVLQKMSSADLKAFAEGRMEDMSNTGLRLVSNGLPKFRHGAGDSFLQGLTFNFADEIGSAKDAALGRGGYSENLADRRTARELYERDNPVAAMGSELGGAAITSAIPGLGLANVGKFAAMTPRMARVVSGVTTGGATGAVAGAGSAEEDQRGAGAARGGAVGAATGGVLGTAQNLLGIGVDAAKAMAAPVVRAVAPQTAERMYGRAAEKKVLQAMKQDGITPQQVARTPLEPGKPQTIIERSGAARGGQDGLSQNVTGLANSAVRFPGNQRTQAGDLIAERMGGQTARVSGDLSRAFGHPGGDPMEMAAQLVRDRAAAARPLYQQAYAHPAAQAITDPDVLQILSLPAFRRAYGTARRLAEYDGVQLPPDPRQLQAFDLRTIDYMKRAVDDQLYVAKRQGSIGNTEKGMVELARQSLVQRLDELVPAWGAARAAFAGPTAMREALDDGVELFSRGIDAPTVRARMQNMTLPEAEQFRIGAMEGLRAAMNRADDGRDRVRMIFGSPDKRALLEELLGPEAFEQFARSMRAESVIRRVDDKLRGGSQTAELMNGMADVGIEPTLQALRSGGVAAAAVDYGLRSARGQSQPTAEALGPMLFATDPAAQAALLRRLTTLDRQMMRQAGVTGSIGGGVGSYSLLDD